MNLWYTSIRDGHNQIYLMNADGSDPFRVTDYLNPATTPAWSSDGRHILFTLEGQTAAIDCGHCQADENADRTRNQPYPSPPLTPDSGSETPLCG